MTGTGEREAPGGLPGETVRQRALEDLRESYAAATRLESTLERHANLVWILGDRRDPNRDQLDFEAKTLELVVLWLHDVAADLERRVSEPGAAGGDPDPRRSAARQLRDATESFLEAFRSAS